MNTSYAQVAGTSGPSERLARKLAVGAVVATDYSERVTTHRIVERSDDRSHGQSQSGILFKVSPGVPTSRGPDSWTDADWFTPVQQAEQAPLF